MSFIRIVSTSLCCLLLLCLANLAQADSSKQGKVVYQLDMAKQLKQHKPLPKGGQWVREGPDNEVCFKITVPVGAVSAKQINQVVRIPIDLTPYRGMAVFLTSKAKVDNVSKPQKPWNGVKCMLNFKSQSAGEQWHNQGNVFGSFDWKELSCSMNIPDDVTQGELVLGLQDATGTAWIADVKLVTMRHKPVRPKLPANPGPAYKGHNLPRLRGVMSPVSFREEDFVELEKWNVNVIRWQMNSRSWGKVNKNRDLNKYDKWIATALNDLDKAAQSAQRHGIKLIIDLHSLPGGRLEDKTPRIYVDQKYQKYFIKLWQRIATRYKDNPAIWAYDLANEPVQAQVSPAGVADWLDVQILAAKAIRKIDPDTAISIEVDNWDNPDNFRWLAPVDIPNVIYQVHMYKPGDYTHQGVRNTWGETSTGKKLIKYPGTLNGKPLNKEALRKYLAPVRQFQLDCNAQIFVGEFSAVRWAPGADQYLDDLISIFEEYGWDWTYHAFREWPGWSVEYADEPADRNHHVLATHTTKRAKVLLKWFAKNQHPKKGD